MISKLIKLQEKYSAQYTTWSEEWQTYFEQHQVLFGPFQTTSALFIAATSIGDEKAKELNQTIRNLKNIEKTISQKDPYPSLQRQLAEEQEKSNEVQEDLQKLRKKKIHLERDLSTINQKLNNSSLSRTEKVQLKRQGKDIKNQLQESETEIQLTEENVKTTKATTSIAMKALVEQSWANEVARMNSFTQPLNKFLSNLEVDNTAFSEALKHHDPAKDFTALMKNNHLSQSERE